MHQDFLYQHAQETDNASAKEATDTHGHRIAQANLKGC